ncbi:hypothetical protein AB0M29_37095 [Streptomyces sp. NPDC051976]|uniref:hypothetical protein n=1 Tax=Streptomyces sp. NPDC051976 TaxID=3154947 RepID=UPI00342A28F5
MSWRTSRTRYAIALAAAAALTGVLAAPTPSGAVTPDDVVGSHWIGFGYNQNPQPPNGTTWSGDDWTLMTKRAGYLQPGVVRVMFDLPWFWTGSDTSDHYDFTSDAFQSAEKVVKYYVAQGIPVVSGLFGIGDLTYTLPHTATVQATLAKRLQDDGATPTYWVGLNEPNVATDTKSYSYADWLTATGNLAGAFATAGVDTAKTTISGADTAEAGISGYAGDLGHESAPTCGGGGCNAALVWKLAALNSFTTQVYSGSGTDTAVTFQTSPDGVNWNKIGVPAPVPVQMVTGANGDDSYRYTYTASGLTNAKYLRLSVASSNLEHTVGSMSVSNSSTTLLDPLDDLSKTQSSLDTGAWNDNNNWWLRSAQSGLLGASEAHYYDQELYGAAPEYVEPVLTEAVSQLRAALPGRPILLGETGMKALQDAHGNKNYDFALDTTQPLRMADLAVQEARAGIDGAAAWCLDGYATQTYCGMWGRGSEDPSKVSAHSTALRPWFYTWSLLSRYLPPRATIHAPAEPTGVRVLAAQLPGGGWTFVLVNRTDSTQTVSLTEPTGPVVLNKYLYSRDTPPAVDGNGFPKKVGTLSADFTGGRNLTIAANSVQVFTTAT